MLTNPAMRGVYVILHAISGVTEKNGGDAIFDWQEMFSYLFCFRYTT